MNKLVWIADHFFHSLELLKSNMNLPMIGLVFTIKNSPNIFLIMISNRWIELEIKQIQIYL